MSLWSPVTLFDLVSPDVFPYLAGVTFVATCTTSAALAFVNGHVSGFPYISDTGTTSPESNIFGLMLSVYAVLLGITIWNVYTTTIPRTGAVHGWKCIVGFLAAFGVQIVANFQETVIFTVHITGAMMAFGLATFYLWLTLFTSQHLRIFRAISVAIATLSLILTAVAGIVSFRYYKGKDITHWKPEDGGYTWHAVSVVTEWILATSANAFIVTLAKDIRTDSEQLPLLHSDDDQGAVPTGLWPPSLSADETLPNGSGSDHQRSTDVRPENGTQSGFGPLEDSDIRATGATTLSSTPKILPVCKRYEVVDEELPGLP